MAGQTIGSLVIDLNANVARLQQDMRDATRVVDQQTRQIATSARHVERLGSAFRNVAAAAAAYFSVNTIASLVRQADEYKQLEQRVRLATDATGDFAAVNRALFDLAQQTGTKFSDTVTVFQGLARGAREFGATNEDILKVVGALQRLSAISGASGAQLSAGLLQFSQALAAGTVRAEEFNSLVENIPEVANAIARNLGRSLGQLRQDILDGKVASEDFFDALIRGSDDAATRFEKIGGSAQRGFAALGNSIQRALSALFETTGVLDFIIDRLDKVSDGIDDIYALAKTEASVPPQIRALQEESARASKQLDILRERYDRTRRLVTAPAVRSQMLAEIKAQIEEIIKAQNEMLGNQAAVRAILALDDPSFARPAPEKEPMRVLIGEARGKATEDDKERERAAKRAATQGQRRADAEAEYIRALEREIALYGDSTNLAKIRFEIESQSSRVLTDQGKERAIVLARQLDLLKEQDELLDRSADRAKARLQAIADAARERVEAAKRVIEQTRTPLEVMTRQIAELDKLKDLLTPEQITRATKQIQEDFSRADEATRSLTDATQQFGLTFSSAFEDAVLSGKKLSDVLRGLAQDLARIALRQTILQPLLQGVSNIASGSGSGGGLGSFLSSLFGGARADGGPVSAGRAYLVGEEGPELFVPRQAGAVLANGSGGAVTVQIINQGTPQQVNRQSQRTDVAGSIITLVTSDVQSGGPISRTLENTFGLRRG